jgi:hypothetical protein
VPLRGVELDDGVAVGMIVPGVPMTVGVLVTDGVPAGDGVAVGTMPVGVGEIAEVGEPVGLGSTIPGGIGLRTLGGNMGGRLPSKVPITRASGLG